jgi:asparagine synthase (glutamine-hydrolysing)
MCGIAGVATTVPDEGLTSRAFAATHGLRHRGPDETRFLTVGDGAPRLVGPDSEPLPADVVAGACRLSIIDIDGGRQPLANEASTVWVTFNGEIYNQLELRRQLELLGHRFRTHSDTEVIVHGWEEWRTELLPRLNGMFAFAIIDVEGREVVLARDPLGVKPLYVGTGDDHTWWCSEIGPAERAGLCRQSFSANALRLFLTFRFIPSPYAVWENAWKLPPSSYVRLRRENLGSPPQFERFKPSIRSSLEPRGRSVWREALMTELEQGVRRQLSADVPVASLLSGGIDSTLLTFFMKQHLDEPLDTFGIGFESDAGSSEALAGERAAREIRVPHRSKALLDGDYDRSWSWLVARIGEPMGNTNAAILHAICIEVGKTHKVALCGQGADELLGGYPRHMAERLYQAGRHAPSLANFVASTIYGPSAGHRLTRIFGADGRLDRYVNIFAHVAPEDADALVPVGTGTTRELARQIVGRWLADDDPHDPANDLLRIDARVSLSDDLLAVADLCSMYESVELRVPFLDLAVVELVERMPSRYKIGLLGNRKWLYREAALDRLPAPSRRRLAAAGTRLRPKRGFSPPQGNRFTRIDSAAVDEADWVEPLRTLDAVEQDALTALLLTDSGSTRNRDVLLALSSWLAARELAPSSPA